MHVTTCICEKYWSINLKIYIQEKIRIAFTQLASTYLVSFMNSIIYLFNLILNLVQFTVHV